MISRDQIIDNVQNKFPNIRKPESYADVLLSGWKLKAIDVQSSKRSKDFSDIKKIKPHIFTKCHKDLNLLIKVNNAEYIPSPMSEREPVVFNFDRAQEILDHEKSLILKHIDSVDKVADIAIKTLKLLVNSSLGVIKKKMDQGNIFKQGSTYEKVFNSLKDNKIKSTGYMWFGIRPVPVPYYYLSKSAITMLKNIRKGVN